MTSPTVTQGLLLMVAGLLLIPGVCVGLGVVADGMPGQLQFAMLAALAAFICTIVGVILTVIALVGAIRHRL